MYQPLLFFGLLYIRSQTDFIVWLSVLLGVPLYQVVNKCFLVCVCVCWFPQTLSVQFKMAASDIQSAESCYWDQLHCSFQWRCFTSAAAAWTNTLKVIDMTQTAGSGKRGKVWRWHTGALAVNAVIPAQCWMGSHLHLFVWDVGQHSCLYLFASRSVSSVSYTRAPIVLSVHRHPLFSHLSLALFASLALVSQSCACRDCLHLQHTWGIKGGWNSLIRGRSEKKEGLRTVQHFIYGAVRSLMKPEVALSTNV